MGKNTALWITRTAVLTALLIAAQYVTAPLGTTLVTGALVNFILVVSVTTCGLSSGMAVGLVSPFFAKMIGIGPLWELIPFIAAANALFVFVWHVIGNRAIVNKHIARIVAAAIAAVCKFAALYLGIARIMAPLVLGLPPAAPVYAMFSFPQLFTASAGGALAILALPAIEKAVRIAARTGS